MATDLTTRFEALSSRQRELSEELEPARESRFLEFYVRLIPRVLDAERCSVFIHDPAQRKVWLKAGSGVKERGIEVSVGGSIVGEVISTGRAVIASELESRPGAHKVTDVTTGFVTREVLCVPIRSCDGSAVTGAIQVLNSKRSGGFTEEDRDFLEEAGQHFQRIVESIYLGQEVMSMTEQAVAAASRARMLNYVWAGVSISFLALFGLALGLSLIKVAQNLI